MGVSSRSRRHPPLVAGVTAAGAWVPAGLPVEGDDDLLPQPESVATPIAANTSSREPVFRHAR